MNVNRWVRTARSYLPAAAAAGRGRTLRRGPHLTDDQALAGFRRPNAVVVHAGLEIASSVASIRRQVGQCQVHAFEPNERLHAHLESLDITVHGALLAAHAGTVDLHVARYGRATFDVEASLDHTTAAMFLGERHFAGYRPERASVDTMIVSTATLDSFELAPDILVVDEARGADDTLAGAMRTLAEHRPLIRFDGDATDAIARVERLGYVPARYDPGAACVVLEQPGVQITWLVHPHHRGLLATSVV